MSFLSHLSRRLDEGERAFLEGRLIAADACAHDVLRDLVSLTGRSSAAGSSRLLRAREHECARGCVCEAAVLLALQCAAELRGAEAVDALVAECYAKPLFLPYNVFHVWVQYQISVQRYEECCQQLISYIDTHYSTTTGSGGSSAVAADLLLRDADPSVSDARFVSLLELLLFHVLVPLGSHDEAIAFLRRGRKPRRGQTAAPRDERLAPHIKESWINELLDLQSAGYTHALAACEQLASTDALIATPAASATVSSSYYAGLAALHDSAAYSARGPGGAPALLPPSNLPPSAGGTSTALLHRHYADGEEHIECEGGDVAQRDATSAGSDAAVALRPYPTLQPLLPDPRAPSFLWSAWLASYGHRLYAALHPYAPRLANRMRAVAHWMWTRRGPVVALLILYVAARILAALLRFFRLADLPGVRLLLEEARNFIRIAFISGTGRSLFA